MHKGAQSFEGRIVNTFLLPFASVTASQSQGRSVLVRLCARVRTCVFYECVRAKV